MAIDTEILDWLEDQYGLHRELEITYVVDGYEVEFTYDGNPTDGRQYHGENLRDALRKAMNAVPNAHHKARAVASRFWWRRCILEIDMKNAPNIIKLENLNSMCSGAQAEIGGKYVPARPMGFYSIGNRVKAAYLVFTGKADALLWPGQ